MGSIFSWSDNWKIATHNKVIFINIDQWITDVTRSCSPVMAYLLLYSHRSLVIHRLVCNQGEEPSDHIQTYMVKNSMLQHCELNTGCPHFLSSPFVHSGLLCTSPGPFSQHYPFRTCPSTQHITPSIPAPPPNTLPLHNLLLHLTHYLSQHLPLHPAHYPFATPINYRYLQFTKLNTIRRKQK